MKTSERVHYAKAAIENIKGAYEIVELGAHVGPQDAGYLAYQLGNLQDLIALEGEEIKGAFTWARIGDDDIAQAYAELVEEFRETARLEELEETLDDCAQDYTWCLQGVPGASKEKAERYKVALDEYQGMQNAKLEKAPKRVHLRNVLDVDNDPFEHVVTYTVKEMFDEIGDDGFATTGMKQIDQIRFTWKELDREGTSMDAIKSELVEKYDIDTNW